MARSYVYDGTNWIKEDEILPPSQEYTTKVALSITPPAMLVAEYEDGYGWDALYSAYQDGKKLSVEINTEALSELELIDGRIIRAEINELKEDTLHAIVLFRTRDDGINIDSAELIFYSDGLIAFENYRSLAFRSELDARYIPYDNDTSGLDSITVQDAIDELAEEKQDNLVSGTNIKTINSQSILGSGNLDIPAHINGEYILPSADWEPDGTEYTLELSDTSFLANADYDVCPPPSYLNTYGFCGIYAVSQTDGAITFKAKSLPTENIYVYITRRM